MRIEKKAVPEYFEKVASGEKTFEVRLADQEYKPGDILVLKEWDPKRKAYTGRIIEKTISYSLKTKELEARGFWPKKEIGEKGFVVIGIK